MNRLLAIFVPKFAMQVQGSDEAGWSAKMPYDSVWLWGMNRETVVRCTWYQHRNWVMGRLVRYSGGRYYLV